MRTLTLIPSCDARRARSAGTGWSRRARRAHDRPAFTPLLDAKAASRLLGVPPTWLLAQARAGRVPHHRLGHYVRFSAEDLKDWLAVNRVGSETSTFTTNGRVS